MTCLSLHSYQGFPGSSEGKESTCNVGDLFTSVGNSVLLGFLRKHLGPQSRLLHKLQEKCSLRTFTEELEGRTGLLSW